MDPRNVLVHVILVLVQVILSLAHGYWPSGSYQPYEMQRNIFFHNNPELAPQNYHYQQMNGNQLVNYQSHCNCIKLKYCSPVLDMAQKMYSGFIADYINTQLQVIACNYIEGEMAVCCPMTNDLNDDSREKRGNLQRRHHVENRKWIWDSEEITASEEVKYSKPPTYPSRQYTAYPIQGFFPFSKSSLKKGNRSPFIANYEDINSLKNCPPAFSAEFILPENHTFYKEPESVSTPVPRIPEVTTQASAPFKVPDMETKMSLINDASCGRTIGSRIMGGEDAGIGKFSWMGRLAYRNKSSGRVSYRCAGSLVSDRYVLTAGHCVSNLIESLELSLVRLGDVDGDKENECNDAGLCMKEQDFEIESVTVHPNYNNPRYANDIALVRLKESTASSNTIGPICLPIGQYQESPNALSAGSNGIIAGWGAQSRLNEAQSQMLQWIRLPFVDTSECASFYANYTSSFRSRIMISNSQLCIQGRENGDACAGDSGGPLMSEAELGEDKFILLGLVSFGPRSCGISNFPGVYTRISSYMDWVLKNIQP